MNSRYYLFTFESTHAAIAAQKLLSPLGVIIMPTLREISASCGMSLRTREEILPQAKEIMQSSSIDPTLYDLYFVEQQDGKITCTPVSM